MGTKNNSKHSKSFSLKAEVSNVFRKNPKKPLNYKQVGKAIGLGDANSRDQIVKILQDFKAKKEIEEVQPGKFRLIAKGSAAEGIIDVNTKGQGYVTIEGYDQDVFIPEESMNQSLNGDRVKIKMYALKGGKRLKGEVTSIVERRQMEFVGIMDISDRFAFFVPDSKKIHVDFFVPLKKLNGAKKGDKVIVTLTDWPKDATSPFGEIKEVLGRPGDLDVEMHSILSQYGFPNKFPDDVEKAAAELPIEITEAEIALRKDYRKVTTFTIDPIDAKDFDDAISIQTLKNGNLEIGVHIADVSHYVKEGGIIDKEAVERATSIYLVDRVVPMLPEVLSNNVCSLRPNEEKLTYACIFELNDKGMVQKSWIGRTVIYSDRRYHYDEVQEILEGKGGDFKEELLQLNGLAKIIRKKRMKDGAIGFDKAEVRFNLDEANKPIGVRLKVQKDAHKLIEEFMLLANRTVAETIGRPKKGGNEMPKTFVYRIHDEPNPDKLSEFVGFIKRFGYQFKATKVGEIAQSMNKLLAEVKGKGEQNVIENLAIRTMSKAVYSTDNIGHYGLSFPYYSHFTSPIRRYPDVMAHRLLERYEKGLKSADQSKYEHLCEHSSNMEQKATNAERDSTKYFQVLFMQDGVGKDFKGVVSGVTEWGLYIEIIENKCEGMIKLKEIRNDYYYFDEANFRVIGQNSGKIINLGDELTIKVVRADLMRKQLDFILVDDQFSD